MSTNSSFYTDGEVYDEATVVSNDVPAAPTLSNVPSSFYVNGGAVGEGTVVSSETAPGPQSNIPSSFFTDGGLVGADTVETNDTVPSGVPSQAPSSFYPAGNLYDALSEESLVVAEINNLAAQTRADKLAADIDAANAASAAAAAATSEAHAATSETNAATSEANAATGAATATTQAGIATTSAANAATSETNAATSASTATTQAGIATTKAANAATSASNAATSETNAHTSEVNAATSASSVAAVMAGSVRFDIAQTLTAPQQTQARTNIGAQANLGYIPVNKAGDTITGGLTVNGELVAATNYIRFVTSGGPGYLQYNGGSSYSLGSAGTIWHSGNINPVSKSGDTMTGSLTVQGDIYAKRADNTGVVYLGTTGSYYLYWNGSYYTLASAHLYTAAGRVLGTSTDAGLIQNGRLAFAADYSVNANGMTEPYGGAVMTGFGWSGGATNGRFRYMQLQNYNGTWFTIGYV